MLPESDMYIVDPRPKPPLFRIIKEGTFWSDICPECQSSLELIWFFKKKCINEECGYTNEE